MAGVLGVGAEAPYIDGHWVVTKALMSRSARVLMEGWVAVPGRERPGRPKAKEQRKSER